MSQEKTPMNFWEAERRAWEAAEELEKIVKKFDGEHGQEDPNRRAYFASQCMSLLSTEFAIPAPVPATMDTEFGH